MTEPVEIFGNIFVLLDYQGNFTLKCHMIVGEMKCRNVEHDFVGLKPFVMELNPSQAIMCQMVDLSDKRCLD